MLISALCDYYDVLARAGKILPDGYSAVKIHYLVGLTEQGEVAEIIDYRLDVPQKGKNGKVTVDKAPRILTMPKRTEKSTIDANIAEHRPLYLFGLNLENGELNPADRTHKAKKSHKSFVEKQLAFLEGLDSPVINAYRKFVESWDAEAQRKNPHLLSLGKEYTKAGFAFCLQGRMDKLLHNEEQFKEKWAQNLRERANDGAVLKRCAVSGEPGKIALIHDRIKGLPGKNKNRNVLVCFNSSSVESYGKSQSENSGITELTMKKYTEALNNLVPDRRRCVMLDDVVVVHWAISEDDAYDKLVDYGVFDSWADDDDTMGANDTEDLLTSILSEAREAALGGKRLDISQKIDPNVTFYMVGLKPNSARLAVEFIYRNRFGTILENIIQHQVDIGDDTTKRPVPLWRIKKELVKPKKPDKTEITLHVRTGGIKKEQVNSKSSVDNVDPALLRRLVEAIFNGYAYPEGLLYTVIRRIKSDSDGDGENGTKINPIRIGLIKGYLNRKIRLQGNKEEYTMSLNTENENPAYLCGRLFAVLEKLQLDAAEDKLNRTIKDAYFASACSTPAIAFSKLMRLAQYHIPKASHGSDWSYLMGEITSKLDGEFPSILTLQEQGAFILGYYHQFWVRKEKTEEAETNKENKKELS